jgi:ligand-binding sensor domain-containing protein
VNWTVYNTSNSGLPKNWISSIAIDGKGDKWIGTDGGGLVKFDGVRWTVYNTYNSKLPSNHVRAIAIDEQTCGLEQYYQDILMLVVELQDGVRWTVYNTSNSSLLLMQ